MRVRVSVELCGALTPALPRSGEGARQSRSGGSGPASIPLDLQQLLQPLAHGLLQIVVGLAEIGVAAGDEIVLLAAAGRGRRAATVGLASQHDLLFTALIWRSRLASSGLAQIAFSTGRRAVAQLKLGLPATAISAPSRSSSCASRL